MKRMTLTFDDATYYALKHMQKACGMTINRIVNDLMMNTIVFRECVKDIKESMREQEEYENGRDIKYNY